MNDYFTYLRQLKAEGEIGLVEYEFAKSIIRIDPDISENVISCFVLAFNDQLNGHLCTNLSELKSSQIAKKLNLDSISYKDLISALTKCSSVGEPGAYTPFILENENLYLQKYWVYENELVQWLKARSRYSQNSLSESDSIEIRSLFDQTEEDANLQMVATVLTLISDLVIISGGPGTGKTFTVKKIIEVLKKRRSDLKVALAAPTGKASERLSDSISEYAETLSVSTLHKLLGARSNGEFKYDVNNKLPFEVIIVDEASMMDIRLWVCLIRAIKKSTKLILLGDKDQLSSVEAGSILGDVCYETDNKFSEAVCYELKKLSQNIDSSISRNVLNDHVILLDKSYRTKEGSGITELAIAINDQNPEKVFEIENQFTGVEIISPNSDELNTLIQKYTSEIIRGEMKSQFLCSNKNGNLGTERLNGRVEKLLKRSLNIPDNNEWYEGRRIIISKNNYEQNLKNGEIGVCFKNSDSKYCIRFSSSKEILASQLVNYELAYAITVHKSQGSEFKNVALFLSEKLNPVLTKELLYTGVTRARENTLVIGSRTLIEQVINKTITRASSIPFKLIE